MDVQDRIFGLLDEIEKKECVVVRDDQYEFAEILDAARHSVLNGGRFNLIDTGRFASPEIEWLAEAGAHYYTSDGVRPGVEDLLLVMRACRRGRSSAAFFQHGPFYDKDRSGGFSFSGLTELARKGFIVHLSNREHPRDVHKLLELAEEARLEAGFLVYYHHGSPLLELAGLAARGCRIHLSDRAFRKDDEDVMNLILESCAGGASNIILHVEHGTAEFFLRKWQKEGVVLIFKTPPSEPGSLLGALERKSRRKILDPRTYYLHATFLL